MTSKRNDHRRQASSIHPNTDALFQSAIAHHMAGRLPEAEALYRQILQVSPTNSDALSLLGMIAHQSGKSVLALELIDKAIKINPQNASAHCNRSLVLLEVKQYQAALESCERAIRIAPKSAEAHCNRGTALFGIGRFQEALESCDKAIQLNPNAAGAYSTRGVVLQNLHQYEAALESCNTALRLNPNDANTYSNISSIFTELNQPLQALEYLDKAIRLKPNEVSYHLSRFHIFDRHKQYPQALDCLSQMARMKPDCKYLSGTLLIRKRQLCIWENDEEKDLEAQILSGKKVINPLDLLSVSGSPQVQRKAAEIYSKDLFPPIESTPIPHRNRHDKIRIGYYSADYYDHAVSRLMSEVFEQHDRNRFELYGFSFGPRVADQVTNRVASAMDHFIDLRTVSDLDVVRLSREHEVDIAVDLMGFTERCRTRIFAERAAPIQINYIGYPATMGTENMDYLIADQTLVPGSQRQHYSEKIVYMPDCFQANDSKLVPSAKVITRSQQGLPEQGFVYCCFNNNTKMNAATFDIWMRILKRVEGSVLWLSEDTPWVSNNLRNEAEKRGISAARIIFARRQLLDEHMTRQRLADLFLDTLPFNAGATAAAALWAGLPILTRMGEAFASRMAASLLKAVHLPELITTTEEAYEDLAVELGLNPNRILEIKERLWRNRLITPLFDVPAFTRNLESAYTAVYERYLANLPPDHIYVARDPSSAQKTVR
jgi:predicted O-linked N-acetylglucosamine transferase (SPINDLY family)